MPKQKTQVIQTFNRPGEGVPLTVMERKSITKDGVQGVSLSIDLGRAPVPERQYVAGLASVVQVDEFTHILFGQPKLAGKGLRTMIDIELPPDAILRLLAASTGINASRQGTKLSAGLLVAFDDEPAQAVGLSANMMAASYSGVEACLDFYKTSAFVLANLSRGGDFSVGPVVRVSLPTRILFALYDEFRKIEPSLKSLSTEDPK